MTPRVGLHLLRVGRCRHPEWVTIRGGRLGAVDFPALVALILHPSFGPILYDTGYADHFAAATAPLPERLYRWLTPVALPEDERLAVQLARFGLRPADIELVLISHLHADHVAGLRDLPRARFLVLAAELSRLPGAAPPHRSATLGGRWRALRRGVLPALLPVDFAARLRLVDTLPAADLGPSWEPFRRAFDLLGDRSLLGVPLPGHSPAQLGVLLRTDEDRPVLLAADACWSGKAWREQRLPSLVARPLFDDWGAYRRTLGGLRQVADRHPDLRIVPSHCAEALAASGLHSPDARL